MSRIVRLIFVMCCSQPNRLALRTIKTNILLYLICRRHFGTYIVRSSGISFPVTPDVDVFRIYQLSVIGVDLAREPVQFSYEVPGTSVHRGAHLLFASLSSRISRELYLHWRDFDVEKRGETRGGVEVTIF